MIEFLKTWDFIRIYTQVVVILLCWVVMIIAVIIDFWSGTDSAKARGEQLYSKGFRRSFAKIGDYWRVQVMALALDTIASCFIWYNLPYATMLVTVAVGLVEGKSVIENAREKKSSAGDIPAMLKAIINAATERDAIKIIEELKKEKNGKNNTSGITEQ